MSNKECKCDSPNTDLSGRCFKCGGNLIFVYKTPPAKPDTQLPAEWVIKIDKEAQEKYPYSIQATERAAYKSIAKEYASKLHQVEQEIAQLKQWKCEASELLNPLLDYGQSKEANIPLGESITLVVLERCKQFNKAQQEIESLTNQLKKQNEVQVENIKLLKAEHIQLEKANSTLYCEANEARALLENFISWHESGLLPNKQLYIDIKTFLDGK